MEPRELIHYWLESAGRDMETMEKLYKMEEYPWALFLGQLVLEKTLKAVYTQNVGLEVPRIHDLVRLAILARLEVPQAKVESMDVISSFNLNTRYPDFKLSFQHQCTKEFTEKYINTIRSLHQWLLSLINMK